MSYQRGQIVKVLTYPMPARSLFACGGRESTSDSAGIFELTFDGDLIPVAHSACNAVICETGRSPTHFLLGWRAYAEMRLMTECAHIGQAGEGTLLGIPVHLDPTRESEVIAVPEFEAVLGRHLPKKAIRKLGDDNARHK